MKKAVVLLLLIAGIFLIGTVIGKRMQAPIDPNAADFDAASAVWVGVELGMDGEAAAAAIKEKFGETIEGPGGLEVIYENTLSGGKGYVLASQEGALDNYISAQQIYTAIEGGKVVFVGMRSKCHKGENAGEWTTAQCP